MSWKQPELGHTIQKLRQDKKLTQEELVEKCNLNVRTLQRIESGDVTPRDYTIRSILSVLDYDVDQVTISIDRKRALNHIQIAWVAGIIYFLLGIAETLADFGRFERDMPQYFALIYVAVKALSATTFAFFMLGFAAIGKIRSNSVLQISAYLMLGALVVINLFDIISIFSDLTLEEFGMIKGLEAVAFGGVDIAFGIALLKMKETGLMVKMAGVLEIIVGFFFLTFILAFVGLFFLIAATLLEVIVLYRFYDEVKAETFNL